VAVATIPEPPTAPVPETAPEPTRRPGEIPSLQGGIVASLIGRLGLVIVAFLMSQRLQQASGMVARQQFVQASAILDPLGSIGLIGVALVVLTVGAAGWFAHQVDVSASMLVKFHRPGSWIAAFAPLLLLPLFQLNEHVDLQAGGARGVDVRPGLMAILIAVLLWLPASRIKIAVASTGTKLPFRGQAELDLLALACFWAAWSRTKLAPVDQLRTSELSRVGHMVMIAAVIGLVGTLTSAALLIRTRRVITGSARDAMRPSPGEVTSFVLQVPSTRAPVETRPMVPSAPWRWALLSAYVIWIASHFVSAFIYLQVRGLLDVKDSAGKVNHQIAVSVIANAIGFALVFLAQWAWVIVTVVNANRATVQAPSISMTCLFAAVPLATIVAALFFEGAARVDLLFISLMLIVPSYFVSFKMASRAVVSVRGNMMPIRTWAFAIWSWLGIQYFANVMRPPTPQQVLLLGVATAVARAAMLIVALQTAHRVTAAVDVDMHSFHQVKRVS
jgi:hypothetical protein